MSSGFRLATRRGKSAEAAATARPCPQGQRDTGTACATPTPTPTPIPTATTTTTTVAGATTTTTTTLAPYCVPGKVFSRALASCVSEPLAPRWVRVLSGDGALTVLWEDPVSDGGSPLVAYSVQWRVENTAAWSTERIRVEDAGSFGWPGSSRVYRVYIITGLRNETFYRVGVSAENEAGSSPTRLATGVPCPLGKRSSLAGCHTPTTTTSTTTSTTTAATTTTTAAATTTTTTSATTTTTVATTTTTTTVCSVSWRPVWFFAYSSVLGACVVVPAPPIVYGVVSW